MNHMQLAIGGAHLEHLHRKPDGRDPNQRHDCTDPCRGRVPFAQHGVHRPAARAGRPDRAAGTQQVPASDGASGVGADPLGQVSGSDGNSAP